MDIPDFPVSGQVRGHDLLPVKSNPNKGDLRASVAVEGDKVGEAA